MLKRVQGITLIALIITIIVIIILSGVGISLLTGENGILNKAKTAKDEYNSGSSVELSRIDNINEIMDQTTRGVSGTSKESDIISNLDFSISDISISSVKITITPTATDNTKIIGYHIFAVSQTDSSVIAHVTESTTYTFSGLSKSTVYAFYVKAYDKDDNFRIAQSKQCTTISGVYLYNNSSADAANWTVCRDSSTSYDLTTNNYMNLTSNNANYCALNAYYKTPVNITGFSTIKCLLDSTVYDAAGGIALSMNTSALTNLSSFNPYPYSSVLKTSNNDYVLSLDISSITDGNYYIGLDVVRTNTHIKAVWLE